MSDVRLSVETKLYVSHSVPATYTLAGFGALSYTEVGDVASLGEFGGSAQIQQFTPLATGIVKKRKGSIDYGTAAATIGRVAGDAGQGILKEGFDGDNAYDVHSFKVVAGDGSLAFFTGMIGSFTRNIGDANTVTGVSCNIELDNKVVTEDDTHVLIYVAGANGSLVGPTHQVIADGEDGVAVYAHADVGYEFEKWSDDGVDNPRTDAAVAASATLTASFVVTP